MKKKNKKKSNVRLAVMAKLRLERIESGAYDGRFSPKVIPNKKKKANIDFCRKFNK